MSFESSRIPSDKDITAESILQQWYDGPVLLASSSQYRKNELIKLGFKSVETMAVPHEEEQREFNEIIEKEGKHGTFYDPYKTEIPQRIAEAKISYLLEHENISPDTMVVALDTLPMVFTFNTLTSDSPTRTMWSAEHATKPDTMEDVIVAVKDTFRKVAIGYLRYKDTTEALYATHDRPMTEEIEEMFANGYLPKLVRVNTGIAIRFPKQNNIAVTSSYINLQLRKVYELADSPEKLDALAEEVVEAMRASGTSPLDIAGGINYANENVRKILDIKESDYHGMLINEQGTYRGFPSKTFEDFIKTEAKKI